MKRTNYNYNNNYNYNYNYNNNNNSNYNNNNSNYNHDDEEACITMHQPWASLLVNGIKRIEGRSWPSPITGRLWIHAASKVPDAQTIRAMEDFYREIYALDGVTDLKFPEHYPVSKLVGCVEVVGCLKREELAGWKSVSRGVRLEALTNFCWLCERPQKLSYPLKMRGDQGVYNLDKKMSEVAVSSLIPVESPHLVKFPLPISGDYYSLRPGSLRIDKSDSKQSEPENPPSVIAAIAGAQAAAMQYTKKSYSKPTGTFPRKDMMQRETLNKLSGISLDTLPRKDMNQSESLNKLNNSSPEMNRRKTDTKIINDVERKSKFVYVVKQTQPGSNSSEKLDRCPGGPSKILSSALNGIRQG